jgi:hypothetical protein
MYSVSFMDYWIDKETLCNSFEDHFISMVISPIFMTNECNNRLYSAMLLKQYSRVFISMVLFIVFIVF